MMDSELQAAFSPVARLGDQSIGVAVMRTAVAISVDRVAPVRPRITAANPSILAPLGAEDLAARSIGRLTAFH